jgi:hypothetical protein
MSLIRYFTEEDIPQVAELYEKVFLAQNQSVHLSNDQSSPPQSIADSFYEIFFSNPWYVQDISSLVYEARTGEISGFLGVTPRRMMIRGREIRAAVSVHFMLDPDRQTGLAGIQLLKKFFSGPQDLCITDYANKLGRKVWEGIGGMADHIHSLNWIKVLRPSSYALSLIAGKLPGLSSLTFATDTLCSLSDRMLGRMMPHRFHFPHPDLTATELDDETLLACISQFSASYSLHPVYDEVSLPWMIRRAGKYRSFGELQKIALRNVDGELTGWYLYYLMPGAASEVLQLCAQRNTMSEVLDHLFHHAWINGSQIITGRLEPQLMQALSEKECYFNCGPPWVLMHTRDQEILQAIDRGDAFLSKLEGEWCTSYRI